MLLYYLNLKNLDIIYAATVRVFAERPKLNRFVVNQEAFARNAITLSIISKAKDDSSEENVIKLDFNGTENIFEVHEKLQSAITKSKTTAEPSDDIDVIMNVLSKFPTFIFNNDILHELFCQLYYLQSNIHHIY